MSKLRFLSPYLKAYRKEALYALVLLVSLVGLDLALPRLIQRMIDRGIRLADETVVLQTALIMLGISAASFGAAIGNNAFSVRAGEGVARDLRERLFLQIQGLSYSNLDELRTGHLLVVLTSDVNAIKALVQISLRIGTRAPLMMVGSAILMVLTSRELVLALLPVLLLACALIVLFVIKSEPLVSALQTRMDALNGVLQENISGARLVKSLVREDFEAERFFTVNDASAQSSIRVMNLTASMMPALTLCVNIGTVVVIGFGGIRAIDGELSLGEIVAFANYLLSMMVPLVMMTMLANVWAAGLASAERIKAVLDTVPNVRDANDASPVGSEAKSVTFRDVSFSYAGSREPVLKDVVLRAKPGEVIAFLGATGAGKSTLVQLIPRFYDVTAGAVFFGADDVRNVKQADLRQHIAIVPQDALLFSGTIRSNIRYGKPDATDDEVRRAARLAQAHEFIERLPEGYDAPVSPRGSNFSGGQRQRLSIARALIMRPEELILDDSTSAVDVETEALIQEGIRHEAGVTTTFIVAQRVSTVLSADAIYLLDEGRIVAHGTHSELLQTSPEYREIYDSQLGGGPEVGVTLGGPAS
jgi:ATP-binding cassette subfamily B multidrug efflux pump